MVPYVYSGVTNFSRKKTFIDFFGKIYFKKELGSSKNHDETKLLAIV
jgi:hypothetical protein